MSPRCKPSHMSRRRLLPGPTLTNLDLVVVVVVVVVVVPAGRS